MNKILSVLLVASLPTLVVAQTTLESVSSIFQANCAAYCHGGGSPSANLDLSGTPGDLISALVGVSPTNPAAVAKGYKLVDPGYPQNSFLLYKCATTDWDTQYGMEVAEGNTMPNGQPALEKEEIELIRQWIQFGAPQTGTVVDPDLLDDYYNDNGMARIEIPDAPAPSEGFQMHLGPFFLEPGEEIEFYKKEKVNNPSLQNVTRFEAFFNDESHHFLLFEFLPGTSSQEPEGLRPVTVQNAFQDAEYMVGWVDPDVTELPAGTAYKIDDNAVLDLNYHLINYASNGDSILAAEAYINYYTDNATPDLIEMHSELLINIGIFIPNNGTEVSFTDAQFDNTAGPTDSMYVWFLASHTHKYGTDYDIYKRNPDGSQGDQLYEGFYDTEYTFNQGYYDWEHPGNLYFDEVYGELLPINRRDGLIQVAKYQIPGSANETESVIYFGLTTDDEMMLSFIQYTLEPIVAGPNGVLDGNNEPSFMSVYPNPTNGMSKVQFTLSEQSDVRLNVFNSLGQEVKQVYSGSHSAGQASFDIDVNNASDPNGLYLVQLIVDGKGYTKKLLQLNR
jgi:hypothetical protein